MCRDMPLFNFDLYMLATDQDSSCGDFSPWRLVLVMVVQNNLEKRDKQKNNRDGRAGSLV